MESSHDVLRSYVPLRERRCVSPTHSRFRGEDSPLMTSRKTPRKLPEEEGEEEEGMTESEKLSFHLTDFGEILQVLDDFCEIRRLTELLRLRFHRQAAVDMGNQQGVKVKPRCPGPHFNRDGFQKCRIQVPQKRMRAEGTLYSSNRMTARSNSRTSPPFGDSWVISTSASRKRRAIRGPPELQRFKKDLCSRKGSCLILEPSLPDTDLSEYNNGKYSSSGSLENVRSTKDGGGRSPTAKKIHPRGDGDQAKAAGAEKMNEETGNMTVAQRVMGKIQELEGFIHQVSLSSDLMDEGGDGRDEAHFVLDGDAQRDKLKGRKVFSQNRRGDDERRLIEEFRVLGEALSQSLRHVLKMEAPKAEGKPSALKPNPSRSTERPQDFASAGETVAERISPVLSRPRTSSPCSPSLTETFTSQSHEPSTDSGRDSSASQPTVLDHGPERFSEEELELGDDLLCSGNNANLPYVYVYIFIFALSTTWSKSP